MSVTTLRLIPFSPAKLGDWDHSLRSASKMSQNRFATYLGIPVANIQHWEQGVATPPNYLISLISRGMKYDGYIKSDLTPAQVDAMRQIDPYVYSGTNILINKLNSSTPLSKRYVKRHH
ncbi:MAG: hypothetical protein IJ073_03815 [Lachnospiraceae bacterium]|nr:hypothetical protein [Lachnospiraceae bacterium]